MSGAKQSLPSEQRDVSRARADSLQTSPAAHIAGCVPRAGRLEGPWRAGFHFRHTLR